MFVGFVNGKGMEIHYVFLSIYSIILGTRKQLPSFSGAFFQTQIQGDRFFGLIFAENVFNLDSMARWLYLRWYQLLEFVKISKDVVHLPCEGFDFFLANSKRARRAICST